MDDIPGAVIVAKTHSVTTKSLSNLKSFQKGKSGNPAGAPKGPRLVARAKHDLIKILEDQLRLSIPAPLLEKIREFYPNASSRMSSAEAVMLRLQLAALSGEPWAVKEIADRLHGSVTQKIRQSIEIGPKLDDLSDDELDIRLQSLKGETDDKPGEITAT